jgi:hypothetical protein
MLFPNEETRAGRMLAGGDIRVTVTDTDAGEHITVRFKAMRDNRVPATGGERPVPEENRNWVRSPLTESTHVFIEVPSSSGDFPDKIGTFYPRTGKFYSDRHADYVRVRAAEYAAKWLNGGRSNKDWPPQLRFQEESFCYECGLPLTDPVSIDLGIGPECNRKQTKARHQVKQVPSRKLDPEERELVSEILEAIADLSNAGKERIYTELDIERQTTRR